jgi:hypothetical protein
MTWPTTSIDETKFDAGADSITDSRAELKQMADNINDMVDTAPAGAIGWETITVNSVTDLTADGLDTLNLHSSTGVTLTANSATDSISIGVDTTEFTNVVNTETFNSSTVPELKRDIGKIHFWTLETGAPTHSFTLALPTYMDVGQELELYIKNITSTARTMNLNSSYLSTATSFSITSDATNDIYQYFKITKLSASEYTIIHLGNSLE